MSGIDVDVLVNNAGIIGDLKPAHQSTTAVADALIDINLRAAVHATHVRCCLAWSAATSGTSSSPDRSPAAARPPTARSTPPRRPVCTAFADGLRLDLHGAAIRVTVSGARAGWKRTCTTRRWAATMPPLPACTQVRPSVQPADIAALVGMALSMPAHVDVTRVEVVPTMQVFGGQHRSPADRLVFRIVG